MLPIYGNKIYAPYRPLFPTPEEIPLETTCVTISIPENAAFIGLWIGVLLALCDPENFVQFDGGISTETTAEIFREALIDALVSSESACELMPSPYWDDATDNEESEPETEQVWYGAVTDWLAPVDELNFEQNAALWVLTGFVAYAAGVGAAIFFRTTAKRFIIAIETTDVAEIIRVVVDAAEFGIDTTGVAAGTIIEQEVVTDPDVTEHDIYVIKGEI